MVRAVGIYNWRLQCGKERDSFFQFFLAIREEGPIRAVATPRGVLENFHEHVFADGEIVTDRILCKDGGEGDEEGREGGREGEREGREERREWEGKGREGEMKMRSCDGCPPIAMATIV